MQEDVMTTEALALMSMVSNFMVFGNSLPSPINKITDFVTEGLRDRIKRHGLPFTKNSAHPRRCQQML
jgi:hypothetical protein